MIFGPWTWVIFTFSNHTDPLLHFHKRDLSKIPSISGEWQKWKLFHISYFYDSPRNIFHRRSLVKIFLWLSLKYLPASELSKNLKYIHVPQPESRSELTKNLTASMYLIERKYNTSIHTTRAGFSFGIFSKTQGPKF